MIDTPTLDNLLSQTDDATVKRLILDAYKLGVADGYARNRVKPNYPHDSTVFTDDGRIYRLSADRSGVYHPLTGEYLEGTKPSPHPDVIKVMLANMGVEDDGA